MSVNGTLVEECIDSRVNAHILASKSVPIYTYDVASVKFSTNSHETDYSVPVL